MTDYDKYAFWLITSFPCVVFTFSFPSSCHIWVPDRAFPTTGRERIAANTSKCKKTAPYSLGCQKQKPNLKFKRQWKLTDFNMFSFILFLWFVHFYSRNRVPNKFPLHPSPWSWISKETVNQIALGSKAFGVFHFSFFFFPFSSFF